MSRYLLLVLINLPIIIAAVVGLLVQFKLRKIALRVYMIKTGFWLLILLCLSMTEPIYHFLYSNKLTQTEPLSLFDVIEITGIIVSLFLIGRYRQRLSNLEHLVRELHQELAIKLSSKD